MRTFSPVPATVYAALTLLVSTTACSSPSADIPDVDHFEVLSGDGQTGVVGSKLPDSVRVLAVSKDGERSFRTVTVRVEGEGGIWFPGRHAEGPGVQMAAPAFGRASLAWSLGPTTGAQTLKIFTLRDGGDTLSVLIHATALSGS